MIEKTEQPKKRDGLYIIIILLLLVLSAVLGFLIVNKNKKIAACQSDYQLALDDIEGMEQMLVGYIDIEKGDLRQV
jgi:flagellar basal body-associated protein FliL